MRFVSLKSDAQFNLQILHRARERLVNAHTALINQLRAVLLERGIILPKERLSLMRRLEDLMTGDPAVSARTRTLLADHRDEWAALDQRIKAYNEELAALTREDVQARQLATIPGIGVINASALLAAIGDGSAFPKGHDLAAWLSLTPQRLSTGGKTKLLGISERGNGYLRKQLIHGARAAMPHLAAKPNQLGIWLQAMLTRAHPNVVVVAASPWRYRDTKKTSIRRRFDEIFASVKRFRQAAERTLWANFGFT